MIIPNKGSIVEVKVSIIEEVSRYVKVTNVVINRQGLYLIYYINVDKTTGIMNCINIVRIITHNNNIAKPLNYYSHVQVAFNRFNYYKKGYYCGPIPEMVMAILSRMPISIDRPVDFEELQKLFWKDKPGLSGASTFSPTITFGYPIVHKKRLKKWILRNLSKILINKQKWKKEIAISRAKNTAQYWKDFGTEMENDFKELKEDEYDL